MKWLLLLALPCFAQVQIDCGSSTDQYFSGGTAWSGPWTGTPPADTTLRFGKSFSYQINVPPANYSVSVTLIEPNATGPNQRVMTITANGQASDQIDVWAVSKINKPYVFNTTMLVSTGKLVIQLNGILGNAVVSSIRIEPVSSPSVTFQAPFTFGSKCEKDGEHQFNLSPEGILCICKIKQPNPVWLCLDRPLVEAK